MTARASHHRPHDESGMSLPEVIVYIAVSVIVILGMVSMFASALSAQADTRDRDTATGSVAVAVNSLQASIRNSSAFDVSGNTLRARVAIGNGTQWECRAWSLSGGTLFYTTASSAVAIPVDPKAEGWAELASGLTGTLDAPPGVPFLRSGSQLSYGFHVLVGEAGTEVVLEGGAVPQATGAGSPTSCW